MKTSTFLSAVAAASLALSLSAYANNTNSGPQARGGSNIATGHATQGTGNQGRVHSFRVITPIAQAGETVTLSKAKQLLKIHGCDNDSLFKSDSVKVKGGKVTALRPIFSCNGT